MEESTSKSWTATILAGLNEHINAKNQKVSAKPNGLSVPEKKEKSTN